MSSSDILFVLVCNQEGFSTILCQKKSIAFFQHNERELPEKNPQRDRTDLQHLVKKPLVPCSKPETKML
jgi:hypothetical protein